jgi:tyrosyl-tRNA synthetase
VSSASRPSRRRARVPDDETLRRITTRAVAEIVPHQEFVDGLSSGRPLRLKIGLDPTKPVIHLGWTVPLRKLRQLQDLGHTVVIIIGDWTARIGDPSGASQTRPMLTAEQVQANSQAILPQFYKVLDERRTEIRRQSEWYDKFDLTEVVRLAARFTVAQVLQRDDFAQRYADHRPIGIHELVYPLLQGYDSFAVEADVEFGGTDQKFNNLVGRELQRMLGQKAGPAGEGQAVFLVPLLVGLDGTQKMSQSLGNYIGIDDPPHDMYGKIMSIPDSLTMDYFQLLTDVPDDELMSIRKAVEEGGTQAMDHKMRLAREVVAQFHGDASAEQAQDQFDLTIRTRVPRETSEELAFDIVPLPEGTVDVPVRFDDQPENVGTLVDILTAGRAAPSKSEARRLINQGAVEEVGWVEDGHLFRPAAKPLRGSQVSVRDGMVIRVGKHRFLRIVDADKHPSP